MERIRVRTGSCNHYLGDPCAVCAADWARPLASPKVHTFRTGLYEHIAIDPIYISSPQELADQCRANGVYSQYLAESQVHRTKSHGWHTMYGDRPELQPRKARLPYTTRS